ncbi:dynein axonemal assembly factor 10 [Lycorma delicatula]|uniref:dynein axonemal assembly factor 10 n=1 Tax=Lycorma delicatula TaxID=130591 RepID=UPI003F5196AA
MDKLEKPQIICHVEQALNYNVYETRWIPCSAKFIVLGAEPRGTGVIQIYEISSGKVDIVKQAHKNAALKCGTFGASSLRERYLATGDFEGKMQIWNLEDLFKPIYSVNAHKEIINAIDGIGGQSIGCGAPEIVTGSRDGSVKVWDPRQKEKPVAIMEPDEGEVRRDCWTVTFGNSYNSEERIVCAGYDNGDIKMFDLKAMSVRWETNVKNGVCGLEFDRKDIKMNKLVATTLEATFHVFDTTVQHPKKGFASLSEKAHKSTIWLPRHLPQNRDVFATCGGTGSICLWKYSYPPNRVKEYDGAKIGVMGSVQLLQNTVLSTQPVSSFDWSPDKLGLGICSAFDQAVRVIIVTKLNLL